MSRGFLLPIIKNPLHIVSARLCMSKIYSTFATAYV
jgi:hypothetical protein